MFFLFFVYCVFFSFFVYCFFLFLTCIVFFFFICFFFEYLALFSTSHLPSNHHPHLNFLQSYSPTIHSTTHFIFSFLFISLFPPPQKKPILRNVRYNKFYYHLFIYSTHPPSFHLSSHFNSTFQPFNLIQPSPLLPLCLASP